MAKITIEINTDEQLNRRQLNNLLANCQSEIHDFIVNGSADELSSLPRMGNKEYNLEVKIEK